MCIQHFSKKLLVNIIDLKLSCLHLLTGLLYGTHNFIPAAIIKCNLKMKSVIVLCCLFQLCNPVTDIIIESGFISDYPDTHPVLFRCCQTGLHIITQKLHQCFHLILWTIPVFGTEGIYRQILNPHFVSFLTDGFHIPGPLHMPIITRHSLVLRPASVSVQYDRNMLRHLQIL